MVATTTLTPIINGAGTCVYDGDSTHSTYCPTGDVYSTYGLSNKDYIDYDFTYIYKPTFMKGLQLRASVLNLLDRDPVGAQYGNGGTATTSYIPQLGNPRGRRIELAVTKKF
jgi:outer membrane receptor protein involved in Fe transport